MNRTSSATCRLFSAAMIVSSVVFASVLSRVAIAQEVPRPGPEHALLKHFEGSWDVVVKFGTEESKGSATYKLVCGGLWLQCDFTGEFGGTPFQGHGLDGYDVEKKKYVGVWVDSMTTSPMVSEGTYDAATKKLTYISDGKGLDGKPAKIRSVTTLKDNDRHEFQMSTVGPNGEDQLMMSITYTRRK